MFELLDKRPVMFLQFVQLRYNGFLRQTEQESPLPLTDPRDAVAQRTLNVPYRIIICPVAIAYSMEQIIKPVCLCVSVYVHSHARISWWIFIKIGTDVKKPQK